jgi:hypothetical protein
MDGEPPGGRRDVALALGLVLAIQATIWVSVANTNFWGFDEWLHVELLSRGVVDFPHSNRPLSLLWSLPVRLLGVADLSSYAVLQGGYLALSGCFIYLLCRSASGGHSSVALLAGVLTAVWAPTDYFRLMSVGLMAYAGSMCATLGALASLRYSQTRQSPVLLAFAAVLAFLAGRTFEGTLPVLIAGGGLLLWHGRDRITWLGRGAWVAACGAAAALVVAGLLDPEATSYQQGLAFDATPTTVARRLASQLAAHLGAAVLLGVSLKDLCDLRVWPGGLLLLCWAGFRTGGRPGEAVHIRAPLVKLAAVGCFGALLAYLPFVLSATIQGSVRTQFLSGAGVGTCLAALCGLLASLAPTRRRHAAFMALAIALVTIAGARTRKLQRGWDQMSRYPAQHGTLEQLTRLAPAVEPHTLFLLERGAHVWPGSFTFRHAIEYVYARQATGVVWDAAQPLYRSHADASGVTTRPLEILRGPWDVAPTLHSAAETVVLELDEAGTLRILDVWPADIPGAPGPRYRPRDRIRPASPGGPPDRLLR